MAGDFDIASARLRLADALDGPGPLNLVDGHWRAPTGERREDQFDPSLGAVIGSLAYSSDDDLDDAVRVATSALPSWSDASLAARLRPLAAIRDQLLHAHSWLVPLIAIEVGKTLAEAADEVELALELVDVLADPSTWVAWEADPAGVVAGISLYHYPLLTPMWLTLPALCLGNAYVLRPCTWSPVTSSLAARVIGDAGYPDGVVSVVHGSLDLVNSVLAHPGVPVVSYVGSGPWATYMVDVGRSHGKRVDAYGATRQVHVITEDADPAAAAHTVAAGAYGHAGQRWLAGTTALVAPRRASDFVNELRHQALAVRTGVVTEPDTTMGPLVQRFRQHELLDRVAHATTSTDVIVDGSAFVERPGFFFGPTVVDNVPADHPLVIEQVPGPIVSVVRDTGEAQRTVLLHCDADRVVRIVHGDGGVTEGLRAQDWFGALPWTPGRQLSYLVRPPDTTVSAAGPVDA